MATGGISCDAGLTYPAIGDIYVERAMIKSASMTYLLADSTKIGRMSFSSLGQVELIDVLITDHGISAAERAGFEARGIEVLVAP
eukprot:gene57876-biopygen47993